MAWLKTLVVFSPFAYFESLANVEAMVLATSPEPWVDRLGEAEDDSARSPGR